MNNLHDQNIVISDEVLATIVVTAAKTIDGVSALVPHPLQIKNLAKKDLRFIKLMHGEAQTLTIELMLRLYAGTNVTTVAGKVQRAVKDALQTMTDYTVARVNIRILGVD